MATIIHRGRDHGLPTYTDVRTSCGLSPVTTFAELNNTIDPHVIQALSSIYKDVGDIDLFIGGLSERPLSGAVVGPTFGCLLGQQFQILKKGDRFWYENNIPPSAMSKGKRERVRENGFGDTSFLFFPVRPTELHFMAFLSLQRPSGMWTSLVVAVVVE